MNIVHEIIPGLFLADVLQVLQSDINFDSVVNCTQELGNVLKKDDYCYMKIPLTDTDTFEEGMLFYSNMSKIHSFIDLELSRQKKIVIHCQLGKSRSPSVVASYLIHSKLCSNVKEAWKYIHDIRPCINKKMLICYENAINN
jgi:protein-tyrosine phosphatase